MARTLARLRGRAAATNRAKAEANGDSITERTHVFACPRMYGFWCSSRLDYARAATSVPSQLNPVPDSGLPVGYPSPLPEWWLRQQELSPEAAEELAQKPIGNEFCLGADLKAGCLSETGIIVVFECACFPLLAGEP
jgi:hypothetical protein